MLNHAAHPRLSTAVAESMVNRAIDRRGAHRLIQVRLAVLAGSLQALFRR